MITRKSARGEADKQVDPKNILGDTVRMYLKDDNRFYFRLIGYQKKTETEPGYIYGYDQEGLNRQITLNEIDFIV